MDTADEDPGPRGGQPEGVQDEIQGGSAGSVDFQVGGVGPDPPHGTGPGQFSTQGCAADHREAVEEAGGGGLGLSTADESYGGFGIRRDRGLHPKDSEHGCTIYCDATNAGPL